jgi:hypothetical protein
MSLTPHMSASSFQALPRIPTFPNMFFDCSHFSHIIAAEGELE